MSALSVSTARDNLPAAIDAARTEAVFLERHGQRVAVLISPERYEELMDAWEEKEDGDAFDEAMTHGGPTIPWDQVNADLGWA
jgi:PHD/YefM family antitoxin component YafN of YafNO toxin-antitoxin module